MVLRERLFCQTERFSNYLLETIFYHHFPTKSANICILPPVVSHALLYKEGLSAVIKHLPAQGIQQQPGESSWDLGSRECEESWQQQGLELAETQKGSHCEHCTVLQGNRRLAVTANSLPVFYMTSFTRSHLSEFQLGTDCKIT